MAGLAQPPAGESVAAGGPGACPSCGAGLVGDYCHRCGEKRPEARDLTVRHFVKDAAQELTSLDSKLTRTLVTLLFRPGRLTAEWVAGRRGPYLKPLNLCLGIFAVNLFVYTASKQATMFDVRLILNNQHEMARQWKLKGEDFYDRLFAHASERKGVPQEALYDAVNEKWQRNVSLIQPVQIVAFALLLQLVYVFSRRYFVEHLVFAMHFLSFAVLTTTLMWPVYYLVGIRMSGLNFALGMSKFAVDTVYLFVALRVFYRGRLALAVVRALVLFGGYFASYALVYMTALLAALISALK